MLGPFRRLLTLNRELNKLVITLVENREIKKPNHVLFDVLMLNARFNQITKEAFFRTDLLQNRELKRSSVTNHHGPDPTKASNEGAFMQTCVCFIQLLTEIRRGYPVVTDPPCANSTSKQNPPICNPPHFTLP